MSTIRNIPPDGQRKSRGSRRAESSTRTDKQSLDRRVYERTLQLEAQSKRLRALARHLTQTETRERKRLAQLLHDHFQQLISAAKMKLGMMRRRSSDPPDVESFKQIEGLLEEAMDASRSLANELNAPVLYDIGLAPALEPSAITVRECPTIGGASSNIQRPLRVVVADDHKLFREGLIALLRQESYMEIVGESGDGQQAVDMARQLRPDLMIVDVTMPRLNGIQVTSLLCREFPALKIVGLSMHEGDEMADAMRGAGAIAYCVKNAPVEVLVNVLRNAAAGEQPQSVHGD